MSAPSARGGGRALVVSIHDVSPATLDVTHAMLADLEAVGVPRTSLLVIPNHHGSHPVTEAPEFQQAVRQWTVAGHEIVLHGYFHRRTAKPGESIRDRVITRVYTAGEGEFHDLSRAEAAALLDRGMSDFAACGFGNVTGFVAPAWLLGGDAGGAVLDAGFHYTTLLGGVKTLRPATAFHASQSLVFSVRSGWRVACSLLWNSLLERRLRPNPLVRLGLHPPDWSHPSIRKQALAICSRLSRQRSPATYADWARANQAHSPVG